MSESLREVMNYMALFGIPSIFAMVCWCIRTCWKYANQIQILMKSQQAQMRTKLLELYNHYIEVGYVTQEQLDDWENQYQAYHSLGKNGVLDARRQTLFALPNKPPKKGYSL